MTFHVIPRAAWGARHPNGCTSAPVPADFVYLHHSVTLAPDLKWLDANKDGVDDDEREAIRTLEAIGQSRFGCGISYTALVVPSGRIYEGHGVRRQGTHTGGLNDRARAICFIGNYEVNKPTNEQLRSAAWLLQTWEKQGVIKRARLTGGHRDAPGASTACPGRNAYAAIGKINTLAAGPPLEEEGEMSFTIEELLAHRVKLSKKEQKFFGGLESLSIGAQLRYAAAGGWKGPEVAEDVDDILREVLEAERRDLAATRSADGSED